MMPPLALLQPRHAACGLVLALLLLTTSLYGQEGTYRVTLSVESDDPALQQEVETLLRQGLQALGDVEPVHEPALLRLSVIAATALSSGQEIGVVLAVTGETYSLKLLAALFQGGRPADPALADSAFRAGAAHVADTYQDHARRDLFTVYTLPRADLPARTQAVVTLFNTTLLNPIRRTMRRLRTAR